MSRRGQERAHGPYKHGNRWRVVYIAANGASETVSYASYAEATEEVEAYRRVAGSRTVAQAVRDYLDERRSEGMRESSHVTARHRLTALLRLDEGDRHLHALTPTVARQFYDRRAKEVKPDTHRGELGYASRWAAWCVARGWLASNPFDGIKPQGQKHSRADEQLRVNEARRVLQVALEEDSLESLVVLMALLMGLRAHEVVERTVRDVDADGTILWVPKSKTKAGRRQLVIPEELRAPLMARCAGKVPNELIFVRDGSWRGATTATRHWLHYHVVRLAAKAGVPRVTPHGLRRTWMTLGVLGENFGGRKTLAQVAADGGHADKGVTAQRHNIAPGAIETATSARVVEILGAKTARESRAPGAADESAANGNAEQLLGATTVEWN